VANQAPAGASTRGGNAGVCREKIRHCQSHRDSVAGALSAAGAQGKQGGQARGRTLIFGGGDTGNGGSGIAPSESLTDLRNILTDAGYGVDVSETLPTNISQYKAIWYIADEALTLSEQSKLEAFVKSGRGLYLTGDQPTSLDESDGSVINALVTGGGIEVGGQGDPDSSSSPNTVNGSAIDEASLSPNELTTWTPNEPGGMGNVADANVLTSTSFSGQSTPTGAIWDGSDMRNGVGRVAILMDINWLESEFWDQATATQMAVNLERFLMFSLPVPVGHNPQWSGYAAKANGVREVSGEWTVPVVECSQASIASAVGIWVGIDGYGNTKLVKAGVGATCASPTSDACYYLFTEVRPGTEDPITDCSGVSPGDDLSIDVVNSPFGSSTFVITISDNGSAVGSPITLTAPSKRDKSAECVVQLPPGKVGLARAHYTQLADFGSVTFTECSATATPDAGTSLDTDGLESGSDGAFKVTSLNLGSSTKSKATVAAPDWPDLSWSVTWLRAK
jgi:hypothetical protein